MCENAKFTTKSIRLLIKRNASLGNSLKPVSDFLSRRYKLFTDAIFLVKIYCLQASVLFLILCGIPPDIKVFFSPFVRKMYERIKFS